MGANSRLGVYSNKYGTRLEQVTWTRSQIYRKSYFSEAEKIATNSRRPWNTNGRFYLVEQCEKSGDFERKNGEVSYSVEKDYADDSKSILAEIKGEDIDLTSDSDNDEHELEIL